MTIPQTATTNLETAIATYSGDAKALHRVAHEVAVPTEPPEPADVKTAQTQLASAFSQLTTAASMEADQVDRAGFAAVAALMQTTADNAAKISAKLATLLKVDQSGTTAPTAAEYAFINTLTSALGVLAQLSPSDVWSARGTSSSRG